MFLQSFSIHFAIAVFSLASISSAHDEDFVANQTSSISSARLMCVCANITECQEGSCSGDYCTKFTGTNQAGEQVSGVGCASSAQAVHGQKIVATLRSGGIFCEQISLQIGASRAEGQLCYCNFGLNCNEPNAKPNATAAKNRTASHERILGKPLDLSKASSSEEKQPAIAANATESNETENVGNLSDKQNASNSTAASENDKTKSENETKPEAETQKDGTGGNGANSSSQWSLNIYSFIISIMLTSVTLLRN